jgi:isoprenylcysteine carboxyl methyltransferase (ICMT) family protein YpbQ
LGNKEEEEGGKRQKKEIKGLAWLGDVVVVVAIYMTIYMMAVVGRIWRCGRLEL